MAHSYRFTNLSYKIRPCIEARVIVLVCPRVAANSWCLGYIIRCSLRPAAHARAKVRPLRNRDRGVLGRWRGDMGSRRQAFAQPNLILECSPQKSGKRSCSILLSSSQHFCKSFLLPQKMSNDYLQIFLLHEGVVALLVKSLCII